MRKKKSNDKGKNIPIPIDEQPGVAIGSDIVTREIQVTGKKQEKRTLPEAAVPFKFKPGQSGNPNGRPRDVLKEIGKRIAKASVRRYLNKEEREIAEQLEMNPDDMNMVESIMLSLATSKRPEKIAMFLERVYGKVPNLNINAQISESLVARFRSKLTDAELERIGAGEDTLQILLDKLPDVNEDEEIVDAEYEAPV